MTSKIEPEKESVLGKILKLLPAKKARQAGADGPKDREAIQAWLVARVATALSVDPNEIDVREPFARFGLDSRTAVSLSGDLERWLGCRLSPTLVWDYPTIEAVAEYLADGAQTAAPAPAAEREGRDSQAGGRRSE